jgi:two-component system alkaline phosphatase synthesis response regulator PhoP
VIRLRILIVEDEAGLRLTLSDRLVAEGYSVQTADNGTDGYRLACDRSFDLIILDLMLPGKTGFDVCRDLRAKGFYQPVLMLTARGEVTDKVVGLKLGADDYLTKPFEMIELLARVEALLRRTQKVVPTGGYSDNIYRIDDIEINLKRAEVWRNDELLDLSAQEFRLLQYLMLHSGETLSRQQLLDEVWGYETMPSTRTVDVHIAWLRQKIEQNPRHPSRILTVHKLGYKFIG